MTDRRVKAVSNSTKVAHTCATCQHMPGAGAGWAMWKCFRINGLEIVKRSGGKSIFQITQFGQMRGNDNNSKLGRKWEK